MGFLILVRSTAADEPGTLDRIIDMLRKLRDDEDVYAATCLVLGDWANPPAFAGVNVRNELVPLDLRADTFLATLIDAVLGRTPIDMHVPVREKRGHRDLELPEADEAGDTAGES